MTSLNEKIEILSVDLLDQHRPQAEELKALCVGLNIELGWHYLLDLIWILENLDEVRGKQVLDAGAGLGVMQWYLLERGAGRVVSVDRLDRSEALLSIRARYNVRGMRRGDLKPATAIWWKNVGAAHGWRKLITALRGLGGLLLTALPKAFPGKLIMYHQDLTSLPEVAEDSLDAVVAVSALEHNAPEHLDAIIAEVMRKLKPGGRLLATLGAAKEKDWFHAPSQGWNYTDVTLRRLFGLGPETASNYARYDELFAALKDCAELRQNLAPSYFRSGENGMPWGKWDPQYQPVGVCKVKPAGG